MAREQNGSIVAGEEETNTDRRAATGEDNEERRVKKSKSKRRYDSSDDSAGDSPPLDSRRQSHHRSLRKLKERESDQEVSSYSDESDSESSESESESERRRRRRREKRRRREREEERERKRRKDKRRRKREEEERKKRKKNKKMKGKDEDEAEKKKKKREKNLGKTGAVTNSWGKYGILRETDMWNKRPEFQAWLSEVKQVNLETLPNWEEKQMFKEFMEDHNTATFPSKKYYDLEAYHRRQIGKDMKKGLKKGPAMERTVFDDEEQRRQELLMERERQKEEQIEALKRSMQTGMAQAMKEQARLREEMAYQYKLGNFEAAAAIQKRLDPDGTLQE